MSAQILKIAASTGRLVTLPRDCKGAGAAAIYSKGAAFAVNGGVDGRDALEAASNLLEQIDCLVSDIACEVAMEPALTACAASTLIKFTKGLVDALMEDLLAQGNATTQGGQQ